MNPILPSLSAVIVSVIYCLYQAHLRQHQQRRQRVLRERVAYLLWTAATRVS